MIYTGSARHSGMQGNVAKGPQSLGDSESPATVEGEEGEGEGEREEGGEGERESVTASGSESSQTGDESPSHRGQVYKTTKRRLSEVTPIRGKQPLSKRTKSTSS